MKKKRTNTKGNIMKVVELGLEQRVFDEMRKPKFSVEAFCRQLADEGIKITPQSVRKFIRKTKNAQQILAQQDLSVAREVKELTMNYTTELKNILTEVQEVKNEAKADKDLAIYDKLVGRIYQGIELLAKLSGEIKPKGSVDIKIIYNSIQDDVESRMRKIKDELLKTSVDVDSIIEEEDEKYAEELRN